MVMFLVIAVQFILITIKLLGSVDWSWGIILIPTFFCVFMQAYMAILLGSAAFLKNKMDKMDEAVKKQHGKN